MYYIFENAGNNFEYFEHKAMTNIESDRYTFIDLNITHVSKYHLVNMNNFMLSIPIENKFSLKK
jgi:hypothetical protein